MPTTGPDSDRLSTSIEALLARIDQLLPTPEPPDFRAHHAFRWTRRGSAFGTTSYAKPLPQVAHMRLADLRHIEHQAERVLRNTQQFVRGLPANNVLLTGARGTGKSSLVRACLSEFGGQGLRLIEVDKTDLADLPLMTEMVSNRPERFIVFCDDLSFESEDAGYKSLKAVLDGGLSAQGSNLLVYATSNRRHLLPQLMSDNLSVRTDSLGEIHPGESIEEKVSLSDRFGLWVSFHAFTQTDYLDIVAHWLVQFGCEVNEQAQREALQWASERGARSGRIALAFAKDWAGRAGLGA
ncbi:MAG: ATP-binding protein [Betaproteobacteria bacterium]|nr:ATP-binding protein [Betaproteobacteria bacterium]NBY14586.1 ATP-binding protein [Betaproteobacteria bacterium]NCA15564.1 ATP-binding protein [Betaproteobacteria bacterium]